LNVAFGAYLSATARGLASARGDIGQQKSSAMSKPCRQTRSVGRNTVELESAHRALGGKLIVQHALAVITSDLLCTDEYGCFSHSKPHSVDGQYVPVTRR